MTTARLRRLGVIVCIVANSSLLRGTEPSKASKKTEWTHGLSQEETYFPIGVWLQNPGNAARYKAAGINLYVALYRGPTAEQLAVLEQAGMRVICSQNEFA